MLNFSRRARRDAPGIQDASLAALLAGAVPPPDAPAPLQHVADVLAALQAAPSGDEAAGKGAALAQFRQRVGVSSQPIRSRRRRPTLLSSLLSAKAAAAAAVAVLGLGGVATAAFAGALPSAAQRLAHDTIGAPSPHATSSAHPGRADASHAGAQARHSGSPVGPSASGAAAFGLCTAYAHASRHGSAAQKAVAFRNLEKAAGGAANVASFCASVPHPGASTKPHEGGRASHPTAAPAPHPTGRPSPHRSGPPSPHPTGAPSHG